MIIVSHRSGLYLRRLDLKSSLLISLSCPVQTLAGVTHDFAKSKKMQKSLILIVAYQYQKFQNTFCISGINFYLSTITKIVLLIIFPVPCLFAPKAQKDIDKGKKSTRF